MKRGFKVIYAARMRSFHDWVLEAVCEDLSWEDLFKKRGLSC